MTTSVVVKGKYKPRPDYAHYTENVYGGIDEKRTLKYSGGVDNHICALCYVFDNAVKCSNCRKYICDACTPWKNQSDDKIFVIEASCPICSKVMYHDFY